MTPRSAAPPRVALVGRPNVGKSTLFNRLYGRREAIVHDRPGVTRDRLERPCEFGGIRVVLEDTGGLVPDEEGDALVREVSRQALGAVRDAAVVVLVIDGRAGITPLDRAVAEILHTSGARTVLAVNKADTREHEALALEGWELGLGEPVAVSAEHGLGVDVLADRVAAELEGAGCRADDVAGEDRPAAGLPDPEEELCVAVVGRPNVGKSSIVNRLAGRERATVSPVPGTTRDAVDVVVHAMDRRVRLVDTAGLRRRSKVAAPDESIGILFTRRRLEKSHVAMLVVDATAGLTSQDVGIAGEIVRLGRPFLVAANKWDAVSGREAAQKALASDLRRRLAFAPWAPLITVSARTGQRVERLLPLAAEIAECASRRVRTAPLNQFLQRAVGEHLAGSGTAPKTFYMTQTGSLPPRFLLFCRDPSAVGAPFRRYLERRLREEFELGPTPVVVDVRRTPRRR